MSHGVGAICSPFLPKLKLREVSEDVVAQPWSTAHLTPRLVYNATGGFGPRCLLWELGEG